MSARSLAKRLFVFVLVLAALYVAVVLLRFVLRDPLISTVYLQQQLFDQATLQKMRDSRVSNMHEVLAERGLNVLETGDSASNAEAGAAVVADVSLRVASPYTPAAPMTRVACQSDVHCRYFSERHDADAPLYPARKEVMQWWNNRVHDAATAPVCGLAFDDVQAGEQVGKLAGEKAQSTSYRLRTFANINALQQQPNYQLTHYQPCGACSTLQDLAVYAELDLTNMASKCSKIMGSEKRLRCMQEGIGFTPACAQVWAYNAARSARYCKAVCIKQYGVWALLTDSEKRSDSMSLETDACLYCDAMVSEPGFQYAAGRSRRNSGIESEIVRDAGEVYAVQHDYWAAQLQD